MREIVSERERGRESVCVFVCKIDRERNIQTARYFVFLSCFSFLFFIILLST